MNRCVVEHYCHIIVCFQKFAKLTPHIFLNWQNHIHRKKIANLLFAKIAFYEVKEINGLYLSRRNKIKKKIKRGERVGPMMRGMERGFGREIRLRERGTAFK